jgi:hypothetical protein
MKKTLALLQAFAVSAVFASTDPEAVPGIDKAREGNLSAKAAEYYATLKPKGCDGEYGKTTYSAAKLSSGSALDDKRPNSSGTYDLTYNATYLVTTVCNTGSTYVGAYREVVSAAIVDATRVGVVANGGAPLKPTKADAFKVVREIDVKLLTGNQE